MKNSKGFTLIELLAVITIMGILMIVAIPSVTRTIENSRKDTFIDTVKQYVNGVKTMWVSDNLSCETKDGQFVSSAVPAGVYYVEVDSSSTSVPQVLESGGKSPWGSRDIRGIIGIAVRIDSTSEGETRVVTYHPALVDGIHGVNVKADGTGTTDERWKEAEKLKRGDLIMSNASYSIVATKNGDTYIIKRPRFEADLNGDGEKNTVIDGVDENGADAYRCVEV